MPELRPYQTAGIAFLVNAAGQRRHAGEFDDQGLGKTIIAIRGAAEIGARYVLVVAKTVALWNWKAEIAEWAPEYDVELLPSSKVRLARPPGANERPRFVVTTHGMLLQSGPFAELVRARWHVLIVDECQDFSGSTAQRTTRLYNLFGSSERDAFLAESAANVWLLSGTPMQNSVIDLWTHLRGLFPAALLNERTRAPMTLEEFRDLYCQWRPTQWGIKVVGNRTENLPDLKRRLAGLFIRRTKEQVLPELPAIRFEVLTLRPEAMPWDITELDGILKKTVVDKLQQAQAESTGDYGVDDAWKALGRSEDVTRMQRIAGRAKVAPVVELLEQRLANDPTLKVVLFAIHLDVIAETIERVAKAKLGCVSITGSTPAAQRTANVARLQEDDSVRVFVGQLEACGTSITLTRASEAWFVQASWTPTDNKQGADRLHRFGQNRGVLVRFVALAGTIDEGITSTLTRKTRMIREVLGD